MTVTPYSAKAHSTGMGTASKESLKAKKSIWEKVFRNRMKKYPHSVSNPPPSPLPFTLNIPSGFTHFVFCRFALGFLLILH